MRIRRAVDQLNIDVHAITGFLHAPLQKGGDAKLLRNLGQIVRRTFETLSRATRNNFELSDLGKTRHDLVLNALGKINILGIGTETLKRQNSDAFVQRSRSYGTSYL